MSVASPCNKVCRVDVHSGLCAGCLRTVEEIAAWRDCGDAERLAVWQRIERRRADFDPWGEQLRGECER
jgi:predicted Fe-S protein YdhL (DUF1289 family)